MSKCSKYNFFLGTIFIVFCLIYLYSVFLIKTEKITKINKSGNIVASDLVSISQTKLNSLLNEKNKVKLVIVYASWCRYCREEIANVLGIIDKYSVNESFVPVFVSVDKNIEQLIDFLNKHEISFVPYIVDDVLKDMIYFTLGNHKIKYYGTIPVMAIIDKHNTVYQGSKYKNVELLDNLIGSLLNIK